MALGYSRNYSTGTVSMFGKGSINTAYGKLGVVSLIDTISGELDIPFLKTLGNLGNFNDDYIKKLYDNIGKDLEPILLKYSTGSYEDLGDMFKLSDLENFSVMLNKDKPTNPFNEAIRELFSSFLMGLQRSILQYSEYINLLSKLEACEEKCSILDDKEKLKEYIENLKRSFQTIPDQEFTVIPATIKPQYGEYIRLYGIPDNFVFDPDKLSEIIKKLNL